MNENLERLQSVTKNFWHLQGLHSVTIGIALVVAAMLDLTGAVTGTRVGMSFSLLISGSLWFNIVIIRRYYREKFGSVIPPPSHPGWVALFVLADAGLASVVLFYYLGYLRGLPFEPFGLACGILFLLLGFPPRRHYLGLGLLVIAFSLLPAFHVPATEQARHGGALLLVGIALVTGGVIDHRTLVRGLAAFRTGESHA